MLVVFIMQLPDRDGTGMMRDYLDSRLSRLREEQRPIPGSWRPFLIASFLTMIAFVLLVLDVSGLLDTVRGAFQQPLHSVVPPMVVVRDRIGELLEDVRNFHRLREENQWLKQRVSQLETDLIVRDQILVENVRLREQLRIQNQFPWKLVGADVIMRSPDAGRRMMTIARGKNDGVQPGMAVVGQTGSEPAALVGIVDAVSAHAANVLLITDVSCRISARVLYDGTTALGLVEGRWQQGSRIRLEQLDREIPLVPGRVVLSAGLTGELFLPLPLMTVPSGIPIGVVERVIESGRLTQFAELRPFIDPEQVRHVWVIVNHGE